MPMKDKKPGDHVILRLKNNESPLIIDWMNHQSNLSDAIRYLIEEEIKAHDVRDLQEYIPAKRKPLQKNVKKHTVEENDRALAQAEPDHEVGNGSEKKEAEVAQAAVTPTDEDDLAEAEVDADAEAETETAEQQENAEAPQQAERSEDEPREQAEQESSSQQSEGSEEELTDDLVDHWLNI